MCGNATLKIRQFQKTTAQFVVVVVFFFLEKSFVFHGLNSVFFHVDSDFCMVHSFHISMIRY